LDAIIQTPVTYVFSDLDPIGLHQLAHNRRKVREKERHLIVASVKEAGCPGSDGKCDMLART